MGETRRKFDRDSGRARSGWSGRPGSLAAVQQGQQAALAGHFAERGGGDDDQLRVVTDPRIVVRFPVSRGKGCPRVLAEQVERGRCGFDEAAPSAEGGGRLSALTGRIVWNPAAGSYAG